MPMRRSASLLLRFSLAFLLSGVLASCGGKDTKDDGPGSGRIPDMPGDAVPRPEARSKYGNGRDLGSGPQYEVLNKTYTVMPNSADYQERGVASWYGKKFHGNLTSNREVYDMYGMTAAHKTLPLPTYVRVRNLRNDKVIVVRVNDRGPFVNNRIIDLSYSAALKLDMIRDGTSLVEVMAISFDQSGSSESAGDRPTRVSTPALPPATSAAVVESNRIFVQVGAFGERENAARRLAMLSQSGIANAFIHEDTSTQPSLYRVRVGPVAGVTQYDRLVEELDGLGIKDPYLITE
jgi:rare lipoprotein A